MNNALKKKYQQAETKSYNYSQIAEKYQKEFESQCRKVVEDFCKNILFKKYKAEIRLKGAIVKKPLIIFHSVKVPRKIYCEFQYDNHVYMNCFGIDYFLTFCLEEKNEGIIYSIEIESNVFEKSISIFDFINEYNIEIEKSEIDIKIEIYEGIINELKKLV